MQRIFDDERRRNGGFQRGPSKSGLPDLVSQMEIETGACPCFGGLGRNRSLPFGRSTGETSTGRFVGQAR
jgi:hypothetical protein